MKQLRKKKKPAMTREMEIESAKLFGKHISRQKRIILLAVTLSACAMPMLLGLRLWDTIPALFSTGLIGMNGQDDSLPRWVIALGMPGLMCILDGICHMQLWIHQDRMKLPPTQVRLLGRWGFPVISVLFCSGLIRQAVGLRPLEFTFTASCFIGLVLVMLGSHMWECPRTAKFALHFSFAEQSDKVWERVHRVAGGCWMTVGILTLLCTMAFSQPPAGVPILVLVSLALPFVYGLTQRSSSTLMA